jgi:hypothetical protein
MKKTLIGLSLLASVASASAVEVGVGYARDISNDVNGVGISVGQSLNKFSLTASAERFDVVSGNQDQVSLVAGYQVLKVMGVAVEAQFGATYITSDVAKDGLTSVVGLGTSVPLTKSISVTNDIRRNIGTGDMKVHDGTTVGVGVKYTF